MKFNCQSMYVRLWLVFIFYAFDADAQGIQSILPFGLNHEVYQSLTTTKLPPLDLVAVKHQQSTAALTPNISFNFKTNYTIDSREGKWSSYSSLFRSWHLKLQSAGAYGLALVFSNIKLLPGEKVFIYNSYGMSRSFDQSTSPKSGVLPLDYLMGDEIVIEFDTPADALETGTFTIETVSHAFQNIFQDVAPPLSGQLNKNSSAKESDCYLCLEGDSLQQIKRAVVRIVVHLENATKICTGTLINNPDRRPYILTAQHCISNQLEAERSVFTFNYEKLSCDGIAVDNLALNGSNYLASMYENDFSIVELNDLPPLGYQPYYAGWDITDKDRDHVACIHHARGGPKTISLFQGTVTSQDFNDGTPRELNAFWKIPKWDAGATEGGSSGAPLFNKKNLVIGTLTGGSSKCGSPYNDYFQRLSKSWESSTDTDQQLKYWLDPFSSGLTLMEGWAPFKGIDPVCNSLSNLQTGEFSGLILYETGTGFFSGYNSDNIASYAEKFNSDDSVMLTGTKFWVGSVNKNSPGGILVAIHQNDQGFPGAVLYETYVPYYKLNSDTSNYIAFYPYINIKGTFFISYTMSYSPEDIFAVQQSWWRDDVENTAYVKLSDGWAAMKDISPEAKGASLNIEALVCRPEIKNIPEVPKPIFSLYPNPASSILVIKFEERIPESLGLQIFNFQGRMNYVNYYQADNNLIVNVSGLSAGVYIVRLSINGKTYHTKFFKSF